MRNKRFPKYPDDADYTTNSPSYYEDLARKQKLIQLLAEKIWDYDERLDERLEDLENVLQDYLSQWDTRIENLDDEVSHIFVTWSNDGTLEQIINHDVLGNKADKSFVDYEISRLDLKDENLTTQLTQMAYSKADKTYVDNTKRDKSVKVEPEDASQRFMDLVTGTGTINLESIPQNDSVGLDKLDQSVFIGFIETKFEQGDIGVDGKNVNSNHRIRSDFFYGNTQTKIVADEGVRYYVRYYNSKDINDSINGVGWRTGEYVLEKDSYVRVVAIYVDDYGGDVPLVFTTVEDLASKVTIQTVKPMTEINNIMNRQDEMTKQTQRVRLDWVHGSIDTTTHDYIKATTLRIVTPQYTKVSKGAVVEFNNSDGVMFSVNIYTDKDPETHILDTGWRTGKYVIADDCYVRLVLRKVDNTEIDESEVDILGERVSAYVPAFERFKYLRDEIDELGNVIGDPSENALDSFVKGIAHRGYSRYAPENTLPAYRLAKEKGFSYAECDVFWTSDNVPVLLHDETIDRTSNGTGAVADLTLAELKTYDFGSWKDEKYAGTQIPTFEEFILLCKKLNIHPYIEIKKTINEERAGQLVDIIKKLGMAKNVTFTSFQLITLQNLILNLPSARVGLLHSHMSELKIDEAESLKTQDNDVFVDFEYSSITKELSEYALLKDIEIEVWTVNGPIPVLELVEVGVSGFTTDHLNVGKILYG